MYNYTKGRTSQLKLEKINKITNQFYFCQFSLLECVFPAKQKIFFLDPPTSFRVVKIDFLHKKSKQTRQKQLRYN